MTASLRRTNQRNAVKIIGRRRPQAAMLRTCPRCGAQPNQSCIREIAARVKGKDIGGGYTVRLKNVHIERKKGEAVAVDTPGTLTGNGHPETSHEAATRAIGKSGGARRRVLEALSQYALTDDEMQYLLRMPANTQRPRRVELVDMGYVQSTGLRRTTPSGADAMVWYISPKGRTVLASLVDGEPA